MLFEAYHGLFKITSKVLMNIVAQVVGMFAAGLVVDRQSWVYKSR